MIPCPGGTVADHPTDNNGETTFSNSLSAGAVTTADWSDGLMVLVSGHPLLQSPFDIYINSPDLNGDLFVDLTDVVLFTQIFHSSYSYAADFNWDAVINLSDLVLLAQAMGASCR